MILLRQGNSRFAVEMIRRFLRLRAGLVCVMGWQALAGAACRADEVALDVHPPSKWVTPRTFIKPKPDDAVDPSQDSRWLLSDRQINAQNDEEFVHEVRQALTPAGVQYGSHILIDYDPTCQSLTLHWARVWRGANRLDRLNQAQVRVSVAGLHPEESLFRSRKTASLGLDDVRVGDIVDYAYSIEGSAPALEGKFFETVPLQFDQPVERAVTRLVWPTSRHIYLTNHLTDLQPARVRKTNVVEFTWAVSNAPGLRLEPPTPIWYDPYPWVQLSEWPRWSDVNRWALRLFTTTNQPSPELSRQINEWKKLPQPADRVLAALRFVQEKVRSLGMEEGSAGYEPTPPSLVFARHYGDGKDKSLLLVTMLRALKIEASPVLVNLRLRQALAQLQPSPLLFNHVIVQVNLDGQSFWLDAMGNYERGPLTLRVWPNYGLGLKIAPGVAGLTAIPPCPVQPRTFVTEYVNVGNLSNETTIQMVKVAEGSEADRMRERFATTAREDIERENLDDFEKFYPFARRTGPLLFSDDEQQNRIEIKESYAIDKIWQWVPDQSYFLARIHAVNVDEALPKPDIPPRTMPLALPYPVDQVFHAEIIISSGLPVDVSNVRIDNPSFLFQRTMNASGGKLFLNYEYRSWTDAISPEAVPADARDLKRAMDALGFKFIGI